MRGCDTSEIVLLSTIDTLQGCTEADTTNLSPQMSRATAPASGRPSELAVDLFEPLVTRFEVSFHPPWRPTRRGIMVR